MKLKLAIAAVAIASPAIAQPTSEEYALMAGKMVSVWSCASLAGYAGKKEEAERLFILGYETGSMVFEAVKTGKVKGEDWSKHSPFILRGLMGGPSTDFTLGRIYEYVMDATMDEIWTHAGTKSDEDRKSLAGGKYGNQNCSFLR